MAREARYRDEGAFDETATPNEPGKPITTSLPERERTISPDFGIDLRGRLNKSRLTSNSFAESSSCQDNVVRRPPNAGRVASLNSKTLTCPLLTSVNRSIARSDRSTSGNANLRNQLQPPPLSFVYKPRYPLQQVSKSNSRRGPRSAYR